MKCPHCQSIKFRTTDSRPAELTDQRGGEPLNAIRRRRVCKQCGKYEFYTIEVIQSVLDHTPFRRYLEDRGAPPKPPSSRCFDIAYALIDGVTLDTAAKTMGYTRQRASQVFKRVLTYIDDRSDLTDSPCKIDADISIIRQRADYWLDVIKVFCEDNDIFLDFDFIYDTL